MTWYPAYCTKQEIIDLVNLQRSDLTINSLSDTWLKFGYTNLFSYLFSQGYLQNTYDGTSDSNSPALTDIGNLLWIAEVCYILEILSSVGVIHYSTGGIEKSKIGNVMIDFMKMQPMFFMGNNPNNMDAVMPFRSFKQAAQQALDAFLLAYQRNNNIYPNAPVNTWDQTSRGYGWNAHKDYMVSADAELTGSIT